MAACVQVAGLCIAEYGVALALLRTVFNVPEVMGRCATRVGGRFTGLSVEARATDGNGKPLFPPSLSP